MRLLKAFLYNVRHVLLVLLVHVQTFKIALFLSLYFFIILLMIFSFAFGFFGVVVIFFRGKLGFGNFLMARLSKILVPWSRWVFAVLFAFGMRVLGRIFVFTKYVFFAFVLIYGDFLFWIRSKIGAAFAGVRSITGFIFRFVIHLRLGKQRFFFSDINFYPLNLL